MSQESTEVKVREAETKTTELNLFNPIQDQPPSQCLLLTTFGKLAGPSVVTCMLSYFCNFTMVIFAAQMPDPINVAVIGLASSLTGIMMLSLLIGMNTA